jgi:tetratricopeptide (TPR) repeat protein
VDVRRGTLGGALAAIAALTVLTLPAAGEENCANAFRSGKLYFVQKVYDKSVANFQTAVELCPAKAEYRWRYANALAEYAGERMLNEYVGAVGQESLLAEILELFGTAGAEFDSSLAVDPKDKSNKKFTNENRQHYWVDHYNRGLKFAKEAKFTHADVEFHVARLIDPHESRAYEQGAVALINSDRKSAAAELVRQGLAVDPENAKLKKLLNSIYVDAANGLIETADRLVRETPYGTVAQAGADSARAAQGFLQKVLEGRPDDPTLYFDIGLAYLTEGGALAHGDSGEVVSPAAQESFRKAAAAFAKAGPNWPSPKGHARHASQLLFNEIRLLSAGQRGPLGGERVPEPAPADPAIWRFLARCWLEQGIRNTPSWRSWFQVLRKELPVAERGGGDWKSSIRPGWGPGAVYTYQRRAATRSTPGSGTPRRPRSRSR